jgi:DNA mismatch endonuclease (patch repair protein)
MPHDRRAHASIALRAFTSGRQIYPYLRRSLGGKMRERYVGEVDAPTREENLARARREVHERSLLDQRGDRQSR